MDTLLKKTIEKIQKSQSKDNTNSEEKKLIINNQDYISIPLKEENFYSIERKSSTKKYAFLDGGNNNIYKDQNMSIDIIRIYYCIFCEEKKIKNKTFDFTTITRTTSESENKENRHNQKIVYKTELIKENNIELNEEFLTFNPKEDLLKNGAFDAKVDSIASKVRRYLEIIVAKQIAEQELKEYDTIILDGTLQCTIPKEEILMQKLEDISIKHNILVCAIAKSTNVYTNTDSSYDKLLISLTDKKRFVYFPSIEIKNTKHPAKIYFAKLHEKSDIVLRIELFKSQANKIDITKYFSQVAFFAKDPTLLGYPYGLIDADKFARLSNEEANYLRTIFEIKTNLKQQDIHALLDKMSF
ncbi:MAG: DNA double-strand break repair nuclease NurA [Candidatus Woesearchaeota archaeon]|jgi:hypothetical protein